MSSLYKVRLSKALDVLDNAWVWAKKNCASYKGNKMDESIGGWNATFVFLFEEEADATMFALRWS